MYPSSIQDVRSNRVIVDNDSAFFFSGTGFRSFLELNIAAGASVVVKFERSCDVIVRKFGITLTDGQLRGEIWTGATPGGTYGTSLPIIPRNTMASRPLPVYQPTGKLTTGGTISGGTLIDLLLIKTSGASGQTSSITGVGNDEYGAASGTGYYKFTNTGNTAAVGLFVILWDELPTV